MFIGRFLALLFDRSVRAGAFRKFDRSPLPFRSKGVEIYWEVKQAIGPVFELEDANQQYPSNPRMMIADSISLVLADAPEPPKASFSINGFCGQ
jgi:hypothetical protein